MKFNRCKLVIYKFRAFTVPLSVDLIYFSTKLCTAVLVISVNSLKKADKIGCYILFAIENLLKSETH